MHLKSIKLLGFKSFVDITTIPIRSQLNAIVGPNGCGKSNVVDAIRWVIGESSAKQLRGQSMSDVIFNGTTARKPVGKAAVELLFDNTDGKLTGEYASYSEIAVRREVQRDGQSDYFINSVGCRRRDIVDIFLGTGLGVRSYSIVEQGMISRLIEAKPDDMRTHIEEVAGISKYKDRRRDTENRIRRTQENLDRVNDIQQELSKQLRHLKRQANAAERYKALKQEEDLLQAQIKALQWQNLQNNLEGLNKSLADQEMAIEALHTKQNTLTTDIDKGKLAQAEYSEQRDQAQKNYYGLAAEIARVEQQIQHTQQQMTRWQEELEQANSLWQDLSDSSVEQQQQIEEIHAELDSILPRTEEIAQVAQASEQRLQAANAMMQQISQRWEQHQTELADSTKQIGIAQNNLSHYQQQSEQLQQRLQQTQIVCQDDQLSVLQADIEPLAQQLATHKQQLAELQQATDSNKQKISEQQSEQQQAKQGLQQARDVYQALQTKQASLQALQQASLKQDDAATSGWLEQQSLDQCQRLAQTLRVDAGWEVAVETVIAGCVDALCVEQVDNLAHRVSELTQGQLTFIEPQRQQSSNITATKAARLADKVNSDWALPWLQSVYIAEDVDQALALRAQLNEQESVVTQDGLWMGRHWLRIAKAGQEQDSVLLRERALEALGDQLTTQQQQLQQAEQAVKQSEMQLLNLQGERDQYHQRYQQISGDLTALQGQLSSKQSNLEQRQQQHQRALQEQTQLQQQIEQLQQRREQQQQQLQQTQQQQQQLEQQRQALLDEREQQQTALEQARAQAQHDRQQADELQIRSSANQSQLALLKQTVERDERQLTQLTERRQQLNEQLAQGDGPLAGLNERLQALLGQRATIETALQTAEQQLSEQQQHLENLQQQQQQCNKQINQQMEQKQQIEMRRQSDVIHQSTLVEQLNETDFTLDAVLAELPEEADIEQWQLRVEQLEKRIQRLGPINLAAIEECEKIEERHTYLEKQEQDLREALGMLESAIKKIDQETRSRFRETYEKVNAGFQRLFPQIFGGGRAELVLTDDDLLTAGVIVNAQPPGKRNATIHMLSGGEKALTAISLVFAIFELNPAPFCVLDEVDAPLDDTNVGRFCNLVKLMSEKIQFIVISHNKVTIEMANHLMGVTMQEPGVSRLVSVDMEEAMAMAEA